MNKTLTDSNNRIPDCGRLLGVDYGSVRIGLAVCDVDRRIASPLKTLQRRTSKLDGEFFVDLVRAEGIVGIVLGLPIHFSGEENAKSLETRRFAEWLRSVDASAAGFF